MRTIFTVYLPTKANPIHRVGNLDNGEQILEILITIAEWAGGYTTSKGIGGWLDDNGVLVNDDVEIVTTICTEEVANVLGSRLGEWAEQLGQDELVASAVTCKMFSGNGR